LAEVELPATSIQESHPSGAIGKRLLDHPPLFDPFQRYLKARVLAVEIEQFIAVRGQQFAGAKHGGQLEFQSEPGLAIPRQIVAVEAVPENPDLVLMDVSAMSPNICQ
jgi:hypothetical protein